MPSTTASTRQLSARPVARVKPSSVRLGAMIAPRFLASFCSVRFNCISALRLSRSPFVSPAVLPSIAAFAASSAATATIAATASAASATTVTGVARPLSSSANAAPLSASRPTPTLSAQSRVWVASGPSAERGQRGRRKRAILTVPAAAWPDR
eukprot:4507448-Prymnesium_polylepis.1